jgi:hypothetical protein
MNPIVKKGTTFGRAVVRVGKPGDPKEVLAAFVGQVTVVFPSVRMPEPTEY